jgi:hyperosmotically inducible periplasmic protein
MSDRSLERAVMTALADNDRVHVDELAVEARGDNVVLRGTVGSLMERVQAMRAARRVPGVRAVDALVHVRPLAGSRLADADTEAAVMAALIDDGGVPTSGIEVAALGDTVTLSGLVEATAQRNRAKRIAFRVGGVAHVRNELRVLSAEDLAVRARR